VADEDDLDEDRPDDVDDDDGWDDAQVEQWVEAVQAEVAYCGTCQPYDEGECVWILGEEMEWDEIFDMCEVPEDEELRAQIARQIECPHCGAGLDDSCRVGVKSEREKVVDDLWATWEEKYGWRFDDLYAYLEKHPYLGLSHDLGAELRDHIGKLPPSTLQEQVWYRARRVSSSAVLSARDMLPPDATEVAISEGRYNHFGQRVFYLAETKEAAAREVLGDEGGLA